MNKDIKLKLPKKLPLFKETIPPYTCIRCGYFSKQRGDMLKHLYVKKKICQSLKNDIDLTDEIKNKILTDRFYTIPTITKLSKNDLLLITNSGNIYIFYSRASKNIDESVYKIGKTYDYIKRQKQYLKGGDMMYVITVKDRNESENIIKRDFAKEFKQRRDYGVEYFEGDIFEMVIAMNDILKDQIIEIIVDFECIKK